MLVKWLSFIFSKKYTFIWPKILCYSSILLFLYPVLSRVGRDKMQYISDERCTPGSQLVISLSFLHTFLYILNKYILSLQKEKMRYLRKYACHSQTSSSLIIITRTLYFNLGWGGYHGEQHLVLFTKQVTIYC